MCVSDLLFYNFMTNKYCSIVLCRGPIIFYKLLHPLGRDSFKNIGQLYFVLVYSACLKMRRFKPSWTGTNILYHLLSLTLEVTSAVSFIDHSYSSFYHMLATAFILLGAAINKLPKKGTCKDEVGK